MSGSTLLSPPASMSSSSGSSSCSPPTKCARLAEPPHPIAISTRDPEQKEQREEREEKERGKKGEQKEQKEQKQGAQPDHSLSSALTLSLAQRCCTDGLHTIYSFLPLPDLLRAAHTCRTWFHAALVERSRGLVVDYWMAPAQWGRIARSALKQHVRVIKQPWQPASLDHLRPLRLLPSLRSLEVHLSCSSLLGTSESCVSYAHAKATRLPLLVEVLPLQLEGLTLSFDEVGDMRAAQQITLDALPSTMQHLRHLTIHLSLPEEEEEQQWENEQAMAQQDDEEAGEEDTDEDEEDTDDDVDTEDDGDDDLEDGHHSDSDSSPEQQQHRLQQPHQPQPHPHQQADRNQVEDQEEGERQEEVDSCMDTEDELMQVETLRVKVHKQKKSPPGKPPPEHEGGERGEGGDVPRHNPLPRSTSNASPNHEAHPDSDPDSEAAASATPTALSPDHRSQLHQQARPLDFTPLLHLPSLRTLVLDGLNLLDVQVVIVRQMESVTDYFEGNGGKWTAHQLAVLLDPNHSKLMGLQRIHLGQTVLTEAHMKSLLFLKDSLVTLQPLQFEAGALPYLPQFTRLTQLDLTGDMNRSGMGSRVRREDQEALWEALEACGGNSSSSSSSSSSSLTSLSLHGFHIDNTRLEQVLKRLGSSLKELALHDVTLETRDLSFLPRGAPNLEELRLVALHFQPTTTSTTTTNHDNHAAAEDFSAPSSPSSSSTSPAARAEQLLSPILQLQQLKMLHIWQWVRLGEGLINRLAPPSTLLPTLTQFEYRQP